MWSINFNVLRSRQRKSNLKGIIVQAKIHSYFYATLIRGHLNISNAVPSAIFDSFANFFLFSGDSSLHLSPGAGRNCRSDR